MFDYDRLEQLIAASGKTKTHLCKAMGKPTYYLRDVFKQKTAIPQNLQEILAHELNTTVFYLNGVEDENKKSPAPEGAELTPDQIRAIEKIKNMPPEELARKMAALQAVLDM